MVNTLGSTGGSPSDWYYAIPPITRLFGTIAIVTRLLVSYFAPWLAIMPAAVVKQFQIWRLFTHILIVPGKPMEFIFKMIWLISYGVPLERTHEFDPAEYALLYLYGATTFGLLAMLTPFGSPLNGDAMVYMLLYLWSREMPNNIVSIWGVMKLQAFYVPFVFVVIDMLVGANYMSALRGIAFGHLYHFIKVLYPRAYGSDLLPTPQWLRKGLARIGLGYRTRVSGAQGVQAPAATYGETGSASGFRAFSGRGQKLGG